MNSELRPSSAPAPDVFNLSAFTEGADPEVTRGRIVSKEPGPGPFPWPEIEPWMGKVRLRSLQVAVHFGGAKPTMAQWLDEGERRLWVDVAGLRPHLNNRTAWGLALIRHCDAALLALSRYFGVEPPPAIPRMSEEAQLEASESEPVPAEMVMVVLPESVRPASRARLWEELRVFLADGPGALQEHWQSMDGASYVSLQASGVREIQRWVKAARSVTSDDDPYDRVLQAVHLIALGRGEYDRAVRSPKRYLDHWPENGGEELLTVFGIP